MYIVNVLLVYVGLAQAHPNYVILIRFILCHAVM